MTLQQVLSQVRRAADDYEMIQDGDKIAVGISGGKDSLTLLYALSTLRRFYPHPFELHAVTVDLGFENLNLGKIEALCKELDVPYTIVPTQIASIVFDQRKEKNPCALCAKMRKGALNEAIRGAGCNKIAYAHHKDDVVETLAEQRARAVDAGRINQHELRMVGGEDAANRLSRGLRAR